MRGVVPVSGAIYKRAEDGIVLVDQDRCRGWRMCVTGCPYKKVYFNHRTGKAEKCTFCFPRIEVGHARRSARRPASGRLRYIGLVLYDADRVLEAAATADEHGPLRGAARGASSTRNDPRGAARRRARRASRDDWIEAAQRSPDLRADQHATRWRCRCTRSTARCRWSGTSRRCRRSSTSSSDTGYDAEDAGNLFAAIDALRIPVEYLAELFTAGDAGAGRPGAARSWPRCAPTCATSTSAASRTRRSRPRSGMTEEEMYDMYRLLAIAKYDERYVIPPAHAEQAHALEELATECSVSEYGGGQHGARSARAPARRRRSRSRTSRCSRTGRPPTPLAAPADKASPGQPAQLGRQGQPERAVPGPATTTRTSAVSRTATTAAGRAHGRQLTVAWQAASLLLGYPDERAARPRST